MTPRIERLIQRIETHAWAFANEGVYAYSYEPGTTRFNQANERARMAEESLQKAIAQLRAVVSKGCPA